INTVLKIFFMSFVFKIIVWIAKLILSINSANFQPHYLQKSPINSSHIIMAILLERLASEGYADEAQTR
ncbi:MAG: hypothetical protein UH853_09275, partial [Muribaculaceae bacterium]|nr:hypothetical protein [Muribaculaceae bacterium]